MSLKLHHLPFDILFCIACNLSLEDIVHLGKTCQQLGALLDERTVCRSIIELDFPYTEEAGLARAQKMTYKQAVETIYARRHALSTADPFSASVWSYGNSFVYGQGMLCVLQGQTVRLSDLRLQSRDLHLDIGAIVGPVIGPSWSSPGDFDVELLNYADGILAIHVTQRSSADSGYIAVLNVTHERRDNGRVIQVVRLTSSSKLFVRHTADFLYYGTHTGIGIDGHHKWEISGICLNKKTQLPDGTKQLLLDNFHGSDIGSTVAFEIHNGYFYAVSNQGTFEVEEIDYTSFYHVARFPIHSPLAANVERDERLYRRQHRQGPIHDSWTDLTLQRDERTNETVIVEARREWAEASSRQSRTFYVTKLEFGSQNGTDDILHSEVMLPEDDIYLPVIDSSNKPQWKPTPDLFSWSQHTEFCSTDPAPRSFMLSRTKFRAYNYGCTTFVDLVEDEACCNDASKPPCLRLRVGSRRVIGITDSLINDKGKSPILHTKRPDFVDSGTRYRQSPIRMWPPIASGCPCSQRLHGILNPPLPSSGTWYTRSVTGVLDEQRLVVMVKAGRSYGPNKDKALGTVIVIDFTRPTNNRTSVQSAPTDPAWTSKSDSKLEPGSSLEWKREPRLAKLCEAGTC